ncbi:MAG: hypothetical protein ABFS35_18310 [Bacteroidota bacterium]
MIKSTNILYIVAIMAFFCPYQIAGQNFKPGESYREKNSYVEYMHGDLPLVISVPHGGWDKPKNIPERKGRFAKNQDIYTIEIAYKIYKNIYKLTGHYPNIVINHLHRTRLDANRNIKEAANGNKKAGEVWKAYHARIDSIEKVMEQKFGKGLFIDLHGHRHKIERIELGYLLSADELRLEEDMLNSDLLNEYCSIRNLLESEKDSLSFTDLIRGEYSLGTILHNRGQACVPNMHTKSPKVDEPYFRGGYNTTRHGSSSVGTIDGIQIEIDLQTRSDKKRQTKVAEDISYALIKFISTHYFPNLGEFSMKL